MTKQSHAKSTAKKATIPNTLQQSTPSALEFVEATGQIAAQALPLTLVLAPEAAPVLLTIGVAGAIAGLIDDYDDLP